MSTAPKNRPINAIIALAIPILTLLILLFLRPLATPDEGRYADVARLMVTSGDYIVPRLNGLPFFHKPPMLYWFEAIAFNLFGIKEWAARLAPALHGIGLLIGLHLFNRQMLSAPFANRCSLVLGLSLPWLLGAQYVNHDMVVASWISLTIMAFAAGIELENKKLMWLGFIASACGVLSKGLIGVVLPGMALFFWIAATQQWRKLMSVPWFSGLSLFLLIGLPWFVLMEKRFPGFFDYFFIEQQFRRFVGQNFNNVQPWWFYWAVLLVLFMPLSVFIFARPSINNTSEKSITALCLSWIISILVFFSLPASKLVGYALPVIAPLTILITVNLSNRIEQAKWRWIFAVSIALMLVLFAGLSIKPPKDTANFLRVGAAFVASAWLITLLLIRSRFSLYASLTAWLLTSALATLWTGQITLRENSTAIYTRLSCYFKPGDTVIMRDEYLYDLPFYLNLKTPIVVYDDWKTIATQNEDDWAHELLEAGKFDSAMNAQVLKPVEELNNIDPSRNDLWLVAAPYTSRLPEVRARFSIVADEGRWLLMRPNQASPLPACNTK